MECEENGKKCLSPARIARGVKRKRRADDAGNLRLLVADSVPGPFAAQPMHHDLLKLPRMEAAHASFKPFTGTPFMNNMDEISYWVFTKRAPCLYNYDKLMKKQNEQAQNSRDISFYSFPTENDVSEKVPPKKKKKNIKLLDDESVISEKQQNVYFETPQAPNHKNVVNNCKSVSPGSDIDFNIKITPKPKAKKPKIQRNTKSNLNKRNKMVTSTPKVEPQNLRRSSRLNKSININGQFDNSLAILNESGVNGVNRELSIIDNRDKEVLQVDDLKSNKKESVKKEIKNETTQGEYDDYSDVSGFTANYIRSTKLHSQTPRKVRRKINRNLMQASRQNVDPESSKMIMCVNKSVNTGTQNSGVLNHSTDSSQNVINLVTVSDVDKSKKVDRSTSLLKFVDCDKPVSATKKLNGHCGNELVQSGSSAASRYPKRVTSTPKQNKTKEEKQNDRKENSLEKIVYRTRSHKRLMDRSCDQVTSNEDSSNAVINVASPQSSRKNQTRCIEIMDSSDDKNDIPTDMPMKCVGHLKTPLDKTKRSQKRDSLRDKSGFAACFSDSGSDTEPLKPRKFFG